METLFFRNRHLLLLAIGGLIIAGISAYLTLPRLEDPRIVNRRATVITQLPGATAERVEALVTEELEKAIREVAEVKYIESTSRAGVSVISVELENAVTDPEPIWSEIRDDIAAVEPLLPPEASRPELDDTRGAVAFSLIVGLTWERESEPQLGIMTRLAADLADRLRYIASTELGREYGGVEEEITVTVDTGELALLGLLTEHLADSIAGADTKTQAGTVRGEDSNLLIQIGDDLDSVTRIGRVPLAEGPNGEILQLSDVAQVAKDSIDPPRQIARVNGKRAVLIAARTAPGGRLDEWSRATHQLLDEFRSTLPAGIGLDVVFEQIEYTNDRLGALARNVMVGILLVMGVVLVLMGWRSALLVGMAIPLTLAAVLVAMLFLGIPIHQISVIGLVIALGLLIDNAIVTVDEIRKQLDKGRSATEAIRGSVRHLFMPLVGSTLTTVLAFLPIVGVPGNVGDFIRTMGINVILAVTASFVISITIIATLAGMFGYSDPSRRRTGWWRSGVRAPRLEAVATRTVMLGVRRPLVGIAIGVFLPLLGFALAPTLKTQFFPAADRNQFYVQVWGSSEASIDHMHQRVQEMETIIRAQADIERVDWLIGASPPTFYYNMLMNQDDASNYAQALVHTTSERAAYRAIRELQAELDTQVPDVMTVVRRLGQGPPIDAPIELRIHGPSLGRLQELGQEVRRHLSTIPEVVHSRSMLDGGEAKVWVDIDEDEARLAGLTLRDISAQLEANLEGSVGGSVLEDTENLPIRIRFANSERQRLESITSLNLIAPGGGGWMPVSALGTLAVHPEMSIISRRDGERTNTIKAYVGADALPPEVTQALFLRLDKAEFTLPPGYRMEVGGDAEERSEAIAGLLGYVPILLVLMVGTLVLSTGSFALAGLLFAVGFFSLGLSMLSVWSFGYPFTFMAIVGSFGLVGLGINDSIVVLAAIRADPQAAAGDRQAIVNEVLGSARHLISTTLTTIGGFIPLMLAGGFWPPLAVAIAGGVSGTTIMALFFVPASYAWLSRNRRLETARQAEHIQQGALESQLEVVA